MKGKIRVFCRLRPLSDKELSMFGKAMHLASEACYRNVFHQTDYDRKRWVGQRRRQHWGPGTVQADWKVCSLVKKKSCVGRLKSMVFGCTYCSKSKVFTYRVTTVLVVNCYLIMSRETFSSLCYGRKGNVNIAESLCNCYMRIVRTMD